MINKKYKSKEEREKIVKEMENKGMTMINDNTKEMNFAKPTDKEYPKPQKKLRLTQKQFIERMAKNSNVELI